MAPYRLRKGWVCEIDVPEWEPLKRAAVTGLVGSFMWMHTVELDGGGRVHAYKHRDTRRYVHLDEDGGAWVYTENEQYREVPLEYVLAAALATWWRTVDRLFEPSLGVDS